MRPSFGFDPESQLGDLIEKLPAADDIQIGILLSRLYAELAKLLEEDNEPYKVHEPTTEASMRIHSVFVLTNRTPRIDPRLGAARVIACQP